MYGRYFCMAGVLSRAYQGESLASAIAPPSAAGELAWNFATLPAVGSLPAFAAVAMFAPLADCVAACSMIDFAADRKADDFVADIAGKRIKTRALALLSRVGASAPAIGVAVLATWLRRRGLILVERLDIERAPFLGAVVIDRGKLSLEFYSD